MTAGDSTGVVATIIHRVILRSGDLVIWAMTEISDHLAR